MTIDYNAAEAAILELLAKTEREMNDFGSALPGFSDETKIHLVISDVIEQDFGWVFCYDSSEHLETGDARLALAGNAPLIFDKADGNIYIAGTADSLDAYLAQYRNGVRTRA